MNALNKPGFLQNNKTFQTIYGRNLLHELNIIIPEETLIVTMEDLWGNFSNFFTKNVKPRAIANSFHTHIPFNIAVATIPGIIRGKYIL